MNNNASRNKSWAFSSADSLSDLDIKVSTFNKLHNYDKSDVILLIDCLASLGVNTYYFSHCANEIAPNLTSRAINILKRLLKTIEKVSPSGLSLEDRSKAFCELYLLTYYYFRNNNNKEMDVLISSYEKYFTVSAYEKETALIYQIKGRFYRYEGRIAEAITNDEKAIYLLEQQKIDNIQAHISFAATLISALQNTADVSYIKKVHNIIPKVKIAIRRYPNVSRYYYLLAKLYLYSLLYDVNLSSDKYNEYMQIARSMIETAIKKEDPQLKAYVKNISKYNALQQVAEMMLVQRRFIDQTRNTLNKKMDSIDAEIQEVLQKTQNRYLEILALFVSIIAIIMAFVQSFSSGYSVFEMVTIIIVMNAGLLTVYAFFLILLRKYQVKYVVVIIICMITIIISSMMCQRYKTTSSADSNDQGSVSTTQSEISNNQSTIPVSP